MAQGREDRNTTLDRAQLRAALLDLLRLVVPWESGALAQCREAALRIWRVGDLDLFDGTWPVIGRDPDWHRDEWPSPRFVRRSDLSRRAWIVQYSDRDPNLVESETPTSYDTNLERDSLHGAGAVEIVLTKLLA